MKLRTKGAMRSQLQHVQRFRRREQRSRRGQTLVEGPQAIRKLLACASGLVRDLYVTEEVIERYGDVAELASAAGVWTHVLAAQDMYDLSADAQGAAAVISTPEVPGLNPFLDEASLVVVTLGIADPGNLGTIIRTADAARADATAVGRASAELYPFKVMRSAAGSHFHVSCVAGVEASELTTRAQEAGLQVLTAERMGEWELPVLTREAAEARILGAASNGPDLRRRTLWFVGNEVREFAGCDFDVDARVAVPLYGKAESLNVSTALAACVYAGAMAQRAD